VASESARNVAWKKGDERRLYRPQRLGSGIAGGIGRGRQPANTGQVLAEMAIPGTRRLLVQGVAITICAA
jgi:hypothetical protein